MVSVKTWYTFNFSTQKSPFYGERRSNMLYYKGLYILIESIKEYLWGIYEDIFFAIYTVFAAFEYNFLHGNTTINHT